MTITMIPIAKPLIGREEIQAVTEVLESGRLAQGPKVAELEERFAKLCGAKYAIAVNNGTAALHTALYASGLQPNDEVITTPFTFVATANSILMMQAKPIFVDIDPETFNLDPNKIEAAVTPKTKAILVVDLYGQPADYTGINRIARKYKLTVIEDAAQSVNADYKNKRTGSLGDIGCFSFYATKNIMCGEGGIITTNNKIYADRARSFRHHSQIPGKAYYYSGLGYNYRLTDLMAAIALVQLEKLDQITKRRQEIATQYDRAFEDIPGIATPTVKEDRSHVYHQYTLRLTKDFPLSRDKFKEYLNQCGIGANIYYPRPLHQVRHLVDKPIKLAVTERACREVISLPVHPLLTDSEVKQIIETVAKI